MLNSRIIIEEHITKKGVEWRYRPQVRRRLVPFLWKTGPAFKKFQHFTDVLLALKHEYDHMMVMLGAPKSSRQVRRRKAREWAMFHQE